MKREDTGKKIIFDENEEIQNKLMTIRIGLLNYRKTFKPPKLISFLYNDMVSVCIFALITSGLALICAESLIGFFDKIISFDSLAEALGGAIGLGVGGIVFFNLYKFSIYSWNSFYKKYYKRFKESFIEGEKVEDIIHFVEDISYPINLYEKTTYISFDDIFIRKYITQDMLKEQKEIINEDYLNTLNKYYEIALKYTEPINFQYKSLILQNNIAYKVQMDYEYEDVHDLEVHGFKRILLKKEQYDFLQKHKDELTVEDVHKYLGIPLPKDKNE